MRSSLTQERLESISLLAINQDITEQLTFDDVMETFTIKPRKKCVL